MKMNKIFSNITVLSIIAVSFITGCDSFDRIGVTDEIYVDHSSITLFVGDKFQLKASPEGNNFEWSSSDTTIATVSNGLVIGVNAGTASIVAKKGNVEFPVTVTVENKAHLTGINLSVDSLEISPNSSTTVLVTTVPENANDVPLTDFAWWSDNENVARVTSAGKITGIGEGATNIHYRRGSIYKVIYVECGLTFPFKGPHILSASTSSLDLPFRDFDKGGEGYAYHDTDTSDAAGSTYRADNGDSNSPGVDIEGSYDIGWTANGEWLLYTLNVQDAGNYELTFTASGNGGTAHFELDGTDVTSLINIPSTSGWGDYQWVNPVKITFTQGLHKLKFYEDQASYNILSMRFTYVK